MLQGVGYVVSALFLPVCCGIAKVVSSFVRILRCLSFCYNDVGVCVFVCVCTFVWAHMCHVCMGVYLYKYYIYIIYVCMQNDPLHDDPYCGFLCVLFVCLCLFVFVFPRVY
jgi:hypothetical protein